MSRSLAELRKPLAQAWACRWMFGVPIATILLPVTLFVFSLPDTYEATAVVRVREMNMGPSGQRLPGERQARSSAIVATTPAQLMTAKNLLAMSRVLVPDTDPGDRPSLTDLRERVRFKRQGNVGFSVSIEDTDPQRAADAVNVLLETFFAAANRGPIKQAESHRAFREEQMITAQAKFKAADKALADFRTKNDATLPEAAAGIQNELATIRSELSMWDQMESIARTRIEFLDQEISRPRVRGRPGSPKGPRGSAQDDGPRQRLMRLLEQLEDQKRETERALQVQRTSHKDKHPDILALLESLKAIDADIDDAKKGLEAWEKAADFPPPAAPKGGDDSGGKGNSEDKGDSEDEGSEPPVPGEGEDTDDDDPLLRFLRKMRKRAVADHARAVSKGKELEKLRTDLFARSARIPYTKTAMAGLIDAQEQANMSRTQAEKAFAEAHALAEYLMLRDAADISVYALQQAAMPPAKPKGPKRMQFVLAALGVGALLGYGLLRLRRRSLLYAITRPGDLVEYARTAMIVTVPLLPDGRGSWKKAGTPLRELALGGWVLLCLAITTVTIVSHYGFMESPAWLGDLMGRSS